MRTIRNACTRPTRNDAGSWTLACVSRGRTTAMADTDEQSTERVWRTIEKIGVGMLTTYGSDGLRARPMQSIVRRDEHAVWFLTDRRGHKLDEIKENPDVLVTYSSGGSEDVS